MKSRTDEMGERVLTLLKLDAKNLMTRLSKRRSEYISIFALKRTRDHFKAVFYTRYFDTPFEILSHCSPDILTALDAFYVEFDNLRWYLNHTEEMPATVEDTVTRMLKRMQSLFDTANLYMDAELGIEKKENLDSITMGRETIPDTNSDETL